MMFDENGRRSSPADIQKSEKIYSRSSLNDQYSGPCKGNCKKYKAKKPLLKSRYSAGQVRCQVCEIFLTAEGVDTSSGPAYCRCCHYRVRTKPRNSLYKEKYHAQISRNVNEPQIESESNEKKQEELVPEKRSAPVYEKIKKSAKTYYELLEFIENEIKPQANYQYVMLNHLLTQGNAHKGKIAEDLALYNNKDPSNIDEVKYFLSVPVFGVLEKSGFVTKSIHPLSLGGHKRNIFKYHLDVDLKEFQKMEIDTLLDKKIEEWNEEHGISIFEDKYEFVNIDWYKNTQLLEEKTSEDEIIQDIQERIPVEHTVTQESVELQEEKSDPQLILKECPKCHYKIVGNLTEIQLNNRIEESFGYRQMDLEDSLTRKPQSYCRKCRRAETIIIEDHEPKQEQISIFELEKDGISIKHYEIKNSEIIQKGQNLTNDEIVAKFGVGNMGGIRYSAKNNLIVLCDTESGHYKDEIDKEFQIIYYTGEGQKGDQTLSGGNQRIKDSKNTSMFYFLEVPQDPGQNKRGALGKIYRFIGKVRYLKHATKTENDINGNPRQVIKFLLEVEK